MLHFGVLIQFARKQEAKTQQSQTVLIKYSLALNNAGRLLPRQAAERTLCSFLSLIISYLRM